MLSKLRAIVIVLPLLDSDMPEAPTRLDVFGTETCTVPFEKPTEAAPRPPNCIDE
jgi:hypothetical protein